MSKFTEETIKLKGVLRQIRLDAELNVNEGADVLGLHRKKLEDIEAVRDYGCYISADMIFTYESAYNVDLIHMDGWHK